jgi:hypothetical protein
VNLGEAILERLSHRVDTGVRGNDLPTVVKFLRAKPNADERGCSSPKDYPRNAVLRVAASGAYYGGGFTVVAGARIRNRRTALSIYQRFSQVRHRYLPKIETFSAAEIELTSPNVMGVHIDGRPLGKTLVKLRALPGALPVFAPKHPMVET